MFRLAMTTALATVLLAGCGEKASKDAQAPEGAPAGGPSGKGVWAAGSSTVFPFSTRVAENFARKSGLATPRVESLGTGGGIKAFCSAADDTAPDIANASRPMKASEFADCQKNGVTDIVEIKIGYDGIVMATARDGADFNLTPKDIYMALAKEVPAGTGFAANPAKDWSQVAPGLPKQRIQVYGPPPTSGTRDAFVELALDKGAEAVPSMKALKGSDEDSFKKYAGTLREDGGWIDSGENDNAIIQTLTKTPGSLGVFGYSYLEQNGDKVKAAKIGGVAPTLAAISDGSYPLSRSLFVYVKKAKVGVKPGLKQFLDEFVSDAAMGRGGYLQERGLIPLPAAEMAAQKQAVATLPSMAAPVK